MGLPVAILSDEELIHYAGIDEDAQAEMTAGEAAEAIDSALAEISDFVR